MINRRCLDTSTVRYLIIEGLDEQLQRGFAQQMSDVCNRLPEEVQKGILCDASALERVLCDASALIGSGAGGKLQIDPIMGDCLAFAAAHLTAPVLIWHPNARD